MLKTNKLDPVSIDEPKLPLQIIVDSVKSKPQLQIEIPHHEFTLKEESQSYLNVSPQTADAETPIEIHTPEQNGLPSPDLNVFEKKDEAWDDKKDTQKPEELKLLQILLEKKSMGDSIISPEKSPLITKPNFATFAFALGYSGKGQRLRSFQVVHHNKLDPMIYWEQKTNIAFCTLNIDFEAINKKFYDNQETLYDVYQRMILEHEDPDIQAFPFDQWFELYIQCLPSDHIFKDYYLRGVEKKLFILTRLDEKSMAQCEMIFREGKAYVRGDHPNKPYDFSEVNKEVPLDSQWLLFDTTLFSVKSIDEQKEFLLEKQAKISNRDLVKMIYVKNITKNKIFVIFDQPGKIYHSTFVSKLFNADGSRLPEDNYDGGTIIFKKGVCLHLENDSGHIRSSKENFLHRGLCKNIIDENAYHALKSLVIHFNNQNKVHEVLRINRSQDITALMRNEGLFNETSQAELYAPLAQGILKINNKHRKKKLPRDSLTLKKNMLAQEEIVLLIGKRIIEILQRKIISETALAEKKFLETILKKYFENYQKDLKKATYLTLKTTSRKTLKKITSSINIGFYDMTKSTKKILEKIDALPYKGASCHLKK